MAKNTIIIADSDTNYIGPLELKFVEEFSDYADLEIITDPDFFQEFFSAPRSACALVVSEQFFNEGLLRHDIDKIYILATDQAQATQETKTGSTVRHIFKYSSTVEIANQVTYELPSAFKQDVIAGNTPQVILVYSMAGGVGTTVTALGIAANLTASHKRVVYIDAEHCHTFQGYLTDQLPAPSRLYSEIRADDDTLYQDVRPYFRNEGFEYLPPFEASLSALNIGFAFYESLVRQLKQSQDYDFIIVDTDSTLNEEKMGLFSLADRIVTVLTQDTATMFKTRILMNNIALNNNEKNTFVCNKYRPERANRALAEGVAEPLTISEYIEYVEGMGSLGVSQLTNVKGFQKIAFLLM